MRSSRGMGAISPSKMPSGKKKTRRDDTDFTQYAKGGEVWDKPRPKSLGKSKKMSFAKKASAKASAKASGRPYPNLVDNMRASKK
tara:strand:- start:4825 stop:5079 length:255 start_codon:yes stop_codon:yes gene_type:complete